MPPSSFPGLRSSSSRAECEPAAPNLQGAEQRELGLLWHRLTSSTNAIHFNHFFNSLIIKDNLKLKSSLKPGWSKVPLINCNHVQKTWGYSIGISWSGHICFCLSQDFGLYPLWGYRKGLLFLLSLISPHLLFPSAIMLLIWRVTFKCHHPKD